MKPPKVTCRRNPASVTIKIDMHSWMISRAWFLLIVNGLKDQAWNLSATNHEDAVYIESIADAISAAVDRAHQKEQKAIANAIFGGSSPE